MPRLERPYTISEVAKMAQWSFRSMRDYLLRKHVESGGQLLIPSRPPNRRYRVTLAALRRIDPDLFGDSRTTEMRVDEFDGRLRTTEERQTLIAKHVGSITRDLSRLKSGPRKSTLVASKSP